MPAPQPKPQPQTLADALVRIRELERALDDAINVILKRDATLESYERRLRAAGVEPRDPPGAPR